MEAEIQDKLGPFGPKLRRKRLDFTVKHWFDVEESRRVILKTNESNRLVLSVEQFWKQRLSCPRKVVVEDGGRTSSIFCCLELRPCLRTSGNVNVKGEPLKSYLGPVITLKLVSSRTETVWFGARAPFRARKQDSLLVIVNFSLDPLGGY